MRNDVLVIAIELIPNFRSSEKSLFPSTMEV